MKLILLGEKRSSSSVLLQFPFYDWYGGHFLCLGQVTSVIPSSHLLAAFRSHESSWKLPCLVVTTLHKALWHIKFSSPKWKSCYIHRESCWLALWNWNFPFSSIPTTSRSHRGQGKSNRNSCSSNTSVAVAAEFSKQKGGTSMLSGLYNFQFYLCLPYSAWWFKKVNAIHIFILKVNSKYSHWIFYLF